MDNTARLYLCARCRCQVMLCSHCDRGNRYCGSSCADQARRASIQAAGSRYQQSRRGRECHAERQRRYRARQQKVTHQGTPLPHANVPLAPSKTTASTTHEAVSEVFCHRCKRVCSPFLRRNFLHQSSSRRAFEPAHPQRPPGRQAQAP